MSGDEPIFESDASGWELTNLGGVCIVNPSGGLTTTEDETPVTFLPMSAVEELTGQIDTSDIRPFERVKRGYTRFREEDVLFAKITPSMENGKVAVARGLENEIGCGTTEFHVVRCPEGVNPDFIRYLLVSSRFRQIAQRNMRGAVGQLRVPPEFVSEARFWLPPSNEQTRIVSKIDELFSRIDAGEANLKRVQALVKQYRQSVLKAAVTGELTRDWREKNRDRLTGTGEDLLKRILAARREAWEAAELEKLRAKGQEPKNDKWKEKYKEPAAPDTTDLPDLPEGWVWSTLGTIAAVVGGITVDRKRSTENTRRVPYLRVANVQAGFLDLDEIKYIDAPIAKIDALRLEHGDVLFTEGGDIDKLGRGWIWSGEFADCIHQNHIFRARLFISDMCPAFVSHYANAMGRAYFLGHGKQTTNLASISLTRLKDFPVPVPPPAEINRVIDALDRELERLGAIQIEVENAHQQKIALSQSILKDAFSGKLVPQDPNDEPASALLERASAERGNTDNR